MEAAPDVTEGAAGQCTLLTGTVQCYDVKDRPGNRSAPAGIDQTHGFLKERLLTSEREAGVFVGAVGTDAPKRLPLTSRVHTQEMVRVLKVAIPNTLEMPRPPLRARWEAVLPQRKLTDPLTRQ